MKKVFSATIMATVLFACGNNDAAKDAGTTDNTTPKSMVTDANANNPDYNKGSELVAKYQCLSCHKVDEKLTGPSYQDVANKYAPAADTTIDRLAKKIIAGGQGVWGDIPMTPHPNVTEADAQAMVKYIMLLKK